MKKKILGIVLSLMLVATMIPMIAFATGGTDTVITEATATVSLPDVGDDGTGITVEVPDGANYTASYVKAYLDQDPYPDVTSENPFKAGKSYVFRVNFTAKAGYYFTYDTSFKINGQVTRCYGDYGSREFLFTMEEATTDHTHDWSTEWAENETHHWHNCKVADCPATDISDRQNYNKHTYDDDGNTCTLCGHTYTGGSFTKQPTNVTVNVGESANVKFTFTGAIDNDYTHRYYEIEDTMISYGENSEITGITSGEEYTLTIPAKDTAGTSEYFIRISSKGRVVSSEHFNVKWEAPTHTHEWSEAWDKNDTHHWHNCTATGCNITDNSQKDGYAAHSGGTATCQEKAVCDICNEKYGEKVAHNTTHHDAVAATCTAKGNVEYWHCSVCEKNFNSAECTSEFSTVTTPIDPINHSGTKSDWKDSNTEHWKTYNCCNTEVDKAAHVYDNDDVDTTCNTCGYERTIAPTIAIVEGNGQAWTKGTTTGLAFKSNADYDDFTRVEVDNVVVNPSKYTATEGSTVVTLKADYLETLSVGEHTIAIVSGNNSPTAKFNVVAGVSPVDPSTNPSETDPSETNPSGTEPSGDNTKPNENNTTPSNDGTTSANTDEAAKTGDSSNLMVWIILMAMAIVGGTATVSYKRKNSVK